MGKTLLTDENYRTWLRDLKSRIWQSQIKASVRINSALLELYWSIGADIVAKQAESVWGSGVLKRLSQDLREEFPDMQGFSVTNLKYMKMFFVFYSQKAGFLRQPETGLSTNGLAPQGSQIGQQLVDSVDDGLVQQNRPALIGQQAVDQLGERQFPPVLGTIPWGHHIMIFSRCKAIEKALFYVHETAQNGWSRAILLNFLDTDLYERQGKATNNFSVLLPQPQSDLAREILKDPYNFDFITLTKGYQEKELEDALTSNITKFLLELGQGFAYVGRQVPVMVGRKEMFIDLLFYHLELRCYTVIELKAGEFEAEYAGKLGVYVSAINHQRKKTTDNPTIGLLICKTKDKIVAEYALESSSQPIGISEYELSKLLPDNYKSALPSIEEIESELKAKTWEEQP
jgi:predicted nuclease of restriction endonuclease-like (RecB) superfamily